MRLADDLGRDRPGKRLCRRGRETIDKAVNKIPLYMNKANTDLEGLSSDAAFTEPEIMVCTWLGKLYCVPPCPTWVLLSYVLHTFISGSAVIGINV